MKEWAAGVGILVGLIVFELILRFSGGFGSNLSITASCVVVMILWYFAVRPSFVMMEEEGEIDKEEEELMANVALGIMMLLGLFVFSSAPIWDPEGYCSYQVSGTWVEVGGETPEEIIKGQRNEDLLIRSDEENCLESPWSYTHIYEAALIWIAGLIGVSGTILIIVLQFISSREASSLGVKQKPISSMPLKKRIKLMEESLGNATRCDWLPGLLVNVDEFNRWRPPAKDCSSDQLKKISELYDRMMSEVNRITKSDRTPNETEQKKIDNLSKKLAPIEKERKKRESI